MKKILLMSAIVFVAGVANAQDIMSKKGTPIIYEAGDWGLAIDANPFLEFAGNAFARGTGSSFNNAPSWEFATYPMVITGFMIKDPNTALRAKLRIGVGSNKQVYSVNDDLNTSTTPRFVEDEQKMAYNNVTLGLGMQKMRGKHRVRGFYGAEVLIGLSGGKTTNTYGNALTLTNPTPTTNIPGQPNGPGRVTESKAGSTFMFGLRGFIGVEYFIAPKITLAGEFGWGPALTSTGAGETTTEIFAVDATGTPTGTTTLTTDSPGKASSFAFDTDNNGGSIRLGFYF